MMLNSLGRACRNVAFLVAITALGRPPALPAQTGFTQPSDTLLAGITARGRLLAEYDFAAWHASDSVVGDLPGLKGIGLFVGYKDSTGWTVVFGELNESRDTFLVHLRAADTEDPAHFTLVRHSVPVPASDDILARARALATARLDMGRPTRPYNMATIPAEGGGHWVYLYPAMTQGGVYPHGGDFRYLITPDGAAILQKRQLHRSIIEGKLPEGVVHGFHTAILDDVPEDTDVFLVLSRQPSIDEMVVTQHFLYRIDVDGSITWTKRDEGR